MKLTIYQVDAFTDTLFKGNPAAVCPLTEWLPDGVMLNIAKENNLAETAFYVRKGDSVDIRWFTPGAEVDLCGHATLAAAFVLKNAENFKGDIIPFHSHRSGDLPVTVQQDRFVLNFPVDTFSETKLTDKLLSATDKKPIAAYRGKTDYMLVFGQEEDIATMKPDLLEIAKLDARGIIVTAKGRNYDFVSRFFGPGVGVNEDPVTGSAHTTLTPYWADQLNTTELRAFQLSERGGEVHCRLLEDRVELAGNAVLYLKGEIYI